MKKVIIALAALMVSVAAYGQGQVVFNNRVPGVVDARVTFGPGLPFSGGVGEGFSAQLLGGPAGTPVDQLVALTPVTTFRTSSEAAKGYVNPTTVTLPNVAPGGSATIVMRAFNGADFGSSAIFGESAPITLTVGGGTLPPANLVGLQGFQVIPEPTTVALGLAGAALLLFRRRK